MEKNNLKPDNIRKRLSGLENPEIVEKKNGFLNTL